MNYASPIDPLSDSEQQSYQSYAEKNKIILYSREQIDKLYNLYTRDSVVNAVIEFVLREVFGGDINIVWDPRMPYLKEIRKGEEKWMDFLRKSITYYYMFGMVPYKVVMNKKKNTAEPVIPDHKSGNFGMKIKKKVYEEPKAVFVSRNSSGHRQISGNNVSNSNSNSSSSTSAFSDSTFSVHVFPGIHINKADNTLPSPIARIIKPYYELDQIMESEILYFHRISHPTVYITRDPNTMKWSEITEGQTIDPTEENALDMVKRALDAHDYEQISEIHGQTFNRHDARNFIRKVNSNKPSLDNFDSRTTRLMPLPSGRKVVFEPNGHFDFNIQERKTEYKKLVCSEIGIEYSTVFSREMAHVGNTEQTSKTKITRIVYNLRAYIDALFEEVFQSAFPLNDFEKVLSRKGEGSGDNEPEEKVNVKYIPKGETSEITLTPDIPLFLPYIDWNSSKKTDENEKIDPEIINLYREGMISDDYIKRYIQSRLPELPRKENLEDVEGEEIERSKKSDVIANGNGNGNSDRNSSSNSNSNSTKDNGTNNQSGKSNTSTSKVNVKKAKIEKDEKKSKEDKGKEESKKTKSSDDKKKEKDSKKEK